MNEDRVICRECGFQSSDSLNDHVRLAHGWTPSAYRRAHPGAALITARAQALLDQQDRDTERPTLAPVESIPVVTHKWGPYDVTVNTDVPLDACLPAPPHYHLPQHGALAAAALRCSQYLLSGRDTWISGPPGTGKDAILAAWSATRRIPAEIVQINPGTDIDGLFYQRELGGGYSEGSLLKALRDGYKTKTGRIVPYLIVLTDIDRADSDQMERLRLVLDTTQRRIVGPQGKVYKVLEGTLICATANTQGGGDTTGRMVSARPVDSSILDRFERSVIFPNLDWKDEEVLLQKKFPLVWAKPIMFNMIGDVSKMIQKGVANGDLYAEFTHRTICKWMQSAQDLLILHPEKDEMQVIYESSACWVQGMPDENARSWVVRTLEARVPGVSFQNLI